MTETSLVATLDSEGYTSKITRTVDDVARTERVYFTANMDVDDDGANGQHGLRIAYLLSNKGRERLSDIGYPRHPDEYSQGLICHLGTRDPKVFTSLQGPYYASRTALRMPGFDPEDPRSAVDAEFYPYAVIPPCIVRATRGKCLGSMGMARHRGSGKTAPFVIADIGPTVKDGEGSPALCRALGLPDDPLSGGCDGADIDYTLFIGVPALLNGTQFALQ